MSKPNFLDLPWFAREYIYDLLFAGLRLRWNSTSDGGLYQHLQYMNHGDNGVNTPALYDDHNGLSGESRTPLPLLLRSLSILLANKIIHQESQLRLLKNLTVVISDLNSLDHIRHTLPVVMRERIGTVSIEAVYLAMHDAQISERRRFACMDLWLGVVGAVFAGVRVLEIAQRAGSARLVGMEGWPGCFLREREIRGGGTRIENGGVGEGVGIGEEYFAGVFSNAWAFRGEKGSLVEGSFLAMGRGLYTWIEGIDWQIMGLSEVDDEGSEVSATGGRGVEMRYRIEIGCGGDPREKSVDLIGVMSTKDMILRIENDGVVVEIPQVMPIIDEARRRRTVLMRD